MSDHDALEQVIKIAWRTQQTSTYLNATLQGIHRSMKRLDRTRRAAARKTAKSTRADKSLANTPARDLRAARKDRSARQTNSLVN
jgi:hypothetical protein